MALQLLSPEEVARALRARDLTDPTEGAHGMQRIVDDIVAALVRAGRGGLRIHRGACIVSVHDNYDALGYTADAVTRDARYTRTCRRPRCCAVIPGADSRALRGSPRKPIRVTCCSRARDWCTGGLDRPPPLRYPHQLDVWRRPIAPRSGDLKEMIEIVVRACRARSTASSRGNTPHDRGLQIDVQNGDEWVEIGECGLAAARSSRRRRRRHRTRDGTRPRPHPDAA